LEEGILSRVSSPREECEDDDQDKAKFAENVKFLNDL
jgi:hypothetical protein